MPALETTCLNQKALLWKSSATRVKDKFGQLKLQAKAEISVRYEQVNSETMNAKNERVATVGELTVDQEVAMGSIVWIGVIDDWSSAETGYLEVVGQEYVPDLKNRNTQRVLILARHSDTLPTLE